MWIFRNWREALSDVQSGIKVVSTYASEAPAQIEGEGEGKMIFKWVLTVLLCIDIISTGMKIGKPREVITEKTFAIASVVAFVFIYGIWNWL